MGVGVAEKGRVNKIGQFNEIFKHCSSGHKNVLDKGKLAWFQLFTLDLLWHVQICLRDFCLPNLAIIYPAHKTNITVWLANTEINTTVFFCFLLQQHQLLAAMETSESGMPSLEVRCQHLLRLSTPVEMTFLEP